MLKYEWLLRRLEALIQKNIREGINRLPSETELCTRYKLSRQTVRTALNILEN